MPSKIRLKTRDFEIEFEGDHKVFLDEILVAVIKHAPTGGLRSKEPNGAAVPLAAGAIEGMSTNTIAAHLGSKTCPDLVIAAAAYLGVVSGQQSFSRQELIDQMKGATSYYRETYGGGNLTSALKTLAKAKRLNLISKDQFSLASSERTTLEQKLGSAE